MATRPDEHSKLPHKSTSQSGRTHRKDIREDPEFSLHDFLQDADLDDPTSIHTYLQGPVGSSDDDDFTWFQEATEQESEDIAAWGAIPDSNEPFVWFQEATHPTVPTAAGPAGEGTAGSLPVSVQEQSKGQPASAPATVPVTAKKGVSHFRPEIEGLRAVSVLMIVVYHVWLGRVSGGVDVFLFISAFLLGSSFARRLDARTAFGPLAYWLRTFTRLMPPAIIAIIGTLIGTWLVLPQSAWQNVISQAIASATYTQNIWLSIRAVDYYALDASTASPLQHFWSLSLQGQVFIVWPVLFILTAFLARKSAHPRRVALGIFGCIAIVSFAYSIYYTAENQSAAYFSTPARAWEVSLGTILALALPTVDRKFGAHRPGSGSQPALSTVRAIAGWIGFALLVCLGIVLDVQGLFPGWIALWPLAGAALIIIAGYSGSRWGFDRILTMKAPRALASSSYCLYLVHWPILILWLSHSNQPRAGLADGFVVIIVSLLVAWLLSKAVDAQFRSPSWKSAPVWRSLTVIATCLALVMTSSLGWRAYLTHLTRESSSVAASDPVAPNAASDGVSPATSTAAGTQQVVNIREQEFDVEALQPKGYDLESQWPHLPYKCEGQKGAPTQYDQLPCATLLPMDAHWDKLIVVVGSSHSRQYIPTFLAEAKEKNWQIINYSMNGCTFGYRPKLSKSHYCADYYERAMTVVEQWHPDLVVMTASAGTPKEPKEALAPGVETAIQNILDLGINVVALRDAPRWPFNAYECAERVVNNGGTPADTDRECGASVTQKLAESNPVEQVASLTGADGARVFTIDYTEQICPDEWCSPIIGNAYVYMDDNHLSKVFTSSLPPRKFEDFLS